MDADQITPLQIARALYVEAEFIKDTYCDNQGVVRDPGIAKTIAALLEARQVFLCKASRRAQEGEGK